MRNLSRLDRTTLSILGLAVVVALFFAVNILAEGAFKATSLDLTQGRIYTLSKGTRELLADLKEPVTLRFYFSTRLGEQVPTYANYAARVRELLERYVSLSSGRIRLEVYNPEPFSDAEDRAVGYGLQGVSLGNEGDQVYFGLAGTNSTDDEQIISFFQPDRERFLEYDVTRLIAGLENPKKKIVGLISSLPMAGAFGNPMMGQGTTPPWTVLTEMREQFTVREFGDDPDKIDKDIDVLMIVHPKKLSEKAQFAIDQFVLGGGRALVFVDPNAESDAGPSPMMMTGATSSDLKKLLGSWGVELVPGKVAGDRTLATRVQANVQGRVQTIDYIAWLSLGADNIDHNDVVTTDVSSLLFATPGILERTKDASTTFTPLVETSSQATEIDAENLRMIPDFVSLIAKYKPVGHPLVLAARVQGDVKSAFPDGPPPDKPAEAKKDAGKEGDATNAAPGQAEKPASGDWLRQSVKPINAIVVADTDMLNDRFWVRKQDFFGHQLVQPTAGNGDFVVNALDNLAGSDALIGLRGRGLATRPFDLVQRIRADADARYLKQAQDLEDRLKDTEKKIASLQKEGDSGQHQILSAEQQQEINKFRADMLTTRQSLREVQHALRVNIERLAAVLKFINIGLIPIVIGILAIVIAVIRASRRRRRYGST
ncbi:MAG TPA: Gldg family protein [Alphaproteobacteria bacterium]|nr:Gldg family protein [Alphaproteobacteria bacterium]